MYGREKLIGWQYSDTYPKDDADKVMDAYEARIAELEKQLEDVQNTMYTENVDLGMENLALKERINELEADIAETRAYNSRQHPDEEDN